MKVAAVIPALNEGLRIRGIVEKVHAAASPVIVIDDGSSDDTAEQAEAAGAVVIRHPLNLGKGAACRSGFYAALKLGCDAIVTLDGDGQHAPAEIASLIEKAERHPRPCIVVGCRMHDTTKMPFLRYATNRLLSLLISFLARQRILDSQSGFRLIHREVLKSIQYNNNRYDAESEILVRAARAGFEICEVPVSTIYANELSKIHKFWDTLRFVRFFFTHLFALPPIAHSPERKIAIDLSENAVSLVSRADSMEDGGGNDRLSRA